MQSFKQFVFRHAWTEEEEWVRPDTADLVNFILIVFIRASNVIIIITIKAVIMATKVILILFRNGFDQSPLTWLRGTGT